VTLDAISSAVARVAAQDPRILAVYLYGSRSRGEERPDSDVDLGILYGDPADVFDVIDLEIALRDQLGLPVQAVDVGRCSAFLAFDIISGERIYCTDSTRCDEFDLYVMRRAGDLAPYERERIRMILSGEGMPSQAILERLRSADE
jgi:predicted nucleotidyltransferase